MNLSSPHYRINITFYEQGNQKFCVTPLSLYCGLDANLQYFQGMPLYVHLFPLCVDAQVPSICWLSCTMFRWTWECFYLLTLVFSFSSDKTWTWNCWIKRWFCFTFENLHTGFHSSCSNLQSHRPCTVVPSFHLPTPTWASLL